MRIVFTTLMLLFAGFLAGGLVAEALIAGNGAGPESAPVYASLASVFVVSSIVFFIMQFFRDVRRASNFALLGMLGLIGIAVVILMGIDLVYEPEHGQFAYNWPMVAGLTAPGAAIVIVQWFIVRWRNAVAKPMILFGRGAGPSR